MFPWFQKRFFRRERPPVYSEMMRHEKAAQELPFLGFMF
jgi:hypothetical protein